MNVFVRSKKSGPVLAKTAGATKRDHSELQTVYVWICSFKASSCVCLFFGGRELLNKRTVGWSLFVAAGVTGVNSDVNCNCSCV